METNEGLARWRLLEEQVDRTLRETQAALDWLVAEQFLREIPRRSGEPVFMMNYDRQRDAEDFVKVKGEAKHDGRR